MLQYALIFESVWMKMPFLFIVFLFIFLSPLSSLYSLFFFLSSFILSQKFLSTHLFFHSFFFSLLFLFSLLFSLIAPLDADLCCCGFFFFFFGSDLMGGFGSGWFLSSIQPRRATRCQSLLLWVFFIFYLAVI